MYCIERMYRVALGFFIVLSLGIISPVFAGSRSLLTNEEKDWLKRNPDKLVLCYDALFPPFEFTDHQDKFTGFGADIIRLIEDELNISFEKVPMTDWNKLIKNLETGDCAIVSTIVRTTEREPYIFFTAPYAKVPIVLIANDKTSKNIALQDLDGLRVGVVSGYATEMYMQEQALLYSFSITPHASVKDGLQSVAFGQTDVFVEDLAVAAYYIDQMGIPNLRVAGTTSYNFEFSIGVSRKYPLLYSSIQKALSAIPEGKLKESQKKWISLGSHIGLSPEMRMLLEIAGIFVVILVLSLLGTSILLKRKLNNRIKDLRASENLFRTIFNLMPSPCVINDLQGRFTMVNEAYKASVGLSEEHIIGKTTQDVEACFDLDMRKVTSELIQKGKLENIETRIKRKKDAKEIIVKYSTHLIEIKGEKSLVSSIIDITKDKEYQAELEASQKRAIAQKTTISKILLDKDIIGEEINTLLQHIAEIVAHTINITRTSIWLFDSKDATMVCKTLYNLNANEFTQGEVLNPSLFPTYVKALKTDNRIFVNNTETDPRTVELYDFYLKPLGISSLLDAGIIIGGNLIGVLSFEHVGQPRKWHPDEELFASTVASIIAQHIENAEREKTEEALRDSEERFSKAFKSNPAPMVISEIETGRFIDTNENWNKMLGYSHEEQIGRTSKEIGMWKDPDDRDQLISKLKKRGSLRNEPIDFVKKTGEIIKTLWSVETFTLGNRKVMLSLIVNETERLKAEEALRASEERYRSIIEVSNTGAWEYHADTQHLWCSNKYYEMLGYDPSAFIDGNKMNIQESWIDLLHPEDKESVANCFLSYVVNGSEGMYENYFRMKHKNGDWVWIWSRGQTLKKFDNTPSKITLGTHINITETKNLEIELLKHKENLEFLVKERTEELASTLEELQATNDELYKQREDLELTLAKLKEAHEQIIQTEKMASLGILTAGIAHEINNPINYIFNGSMAIENYIAENIPNHIEHLKPLMDAINTGITRTTNIVRSLNRYSRKDDNKTTLCNLHDIIDNCLTMLLNQFKNRIDIQKDYVSGSSEIVANEGTLHQAFLNILTNAIQAIADTGVITITTKRVSNKVEVCIGDSGQGISSENIKHIYDPFFTTKDPGKGTGLGLSITRRIIQEHGGSIECRSQIGIGTKFIITLPTNL